MIWSRAVFFVLGCGLLAGACKKEEAAEPAPIPMQAPSATLVAADPVPVASEAPATPAPGSAAVAAPTPPPAAAAAPASEPAGGAATQGGATIAPCCKALSAIALKSGKSADTKAKAGTAATVCSRIDKLVKSGKTSRSSALTQVKSGLVDVTVPDECR
jgi:hypothetical protein